MTIREAIDLLAKIAAKHGDAPQVYFDCPRCLHSFTPNVVATPAIHLSAKPTGEA